MAPSKLASTLASWINAVWPPLFATLFLSLALSAPPQAHELFVVLLQPDQRLPALCAFFCLILASCLISLMARALIVTAKPAASMGCGWEAFAARWFPVACGTANMILAGFAVFSAGKSIPTIPLPDAAVARSTSLAEIVRLTREGIGEAEDLRLVAYTIWVAAVLLLLILGYRSSKGPRLSLSISNRGRRVWVTGITVALLLSVLFSLFIAMPLMLGTVAIVCIFAALFATVLTGMRIDFHHSGWPVLLLTCLAAFIFSALNLNDNHGIHETELATPSVALRVGALQDQFEEWLSSRQDSGYFSGNNEPYPVFIVAARGGGSYAAAQEAIFLARMQDQCPVFAQHVFAISGVSGGSLGAALFGSLVKTHVTNGPWQPCRFGPSQSGPLEQRARAFLKADLLSPIVAAALFPDFVQRFLPFPVPGTDRGAALSRGLEHAWRNAEPDGPNPFESTFLGQWNPTSAEPALLLNTTEVDKGRRVIVAPFPIQPECGTINCVQTWFYQTDQAIKAVRSGAAGPLITRDLRLSEAAGISARFPWVLPAASVERDGKYIRLVDGGYFDNSGIETTVDLMETLVAIRGARQQAQPNTGMRSRPRAFDIHLITISGTVADGPPSWQGLDDVLSPIRTLLSSRDARGILSVTRPQSGRFLYDSNPPTFDVSPAATLDDQDMALALGFQLSTNSIDLIAAQAGQADQDGKIWGPDSVQSAENKDPRISPKQHAVIDNMQANSFTPCRIKYCLSARQMPMSGYACDAGPTH
jgi:hypothetical protein